MTSPRFSDVQPYLKIALRAVVGSEDAVSLPLAATGAGGQERDHGCRTPSEWFAGYTPWRTSGPMGWRRTSRT